MDAAAPRKRPLSPPLSSPFAVRCGARSPRARSREADDGDNKSVRHGSVNREEEGDADAHHAGATTRWSPRRDDAQRDAWRDTWRREYEEDEESEIESESDEPRVSRDVPCCAGWASGCAAAGACVHGARLVRRVHDEDGAAVDVVYTRQFGAAPGGGPRAVVYKTYDTRDNDCLTYLVDIELELYGRMRGQQHTIELLDTFRDARGNPVLVFPYVCDDHTPSTPSAVRAYMRQLLEALAFLHDGLGVMHRNVKRANVLFSGERVLTLIDFEGTAPLTEGALYTRFGNNLYRAPEVAGAKAAVAEGRGALCFNSFDGVLSPAAAYGAAADVFSAGVCFFELLTGQRRMLDPAWLREGYATLDAALADVAGCADARPAFRNAVQAGGAAAQARMTVEAADLLRRMLATQPGDRPDASDALCHPYFRTDAAADDGAYWDALAREAATARRAHKRRRRTPSPSPPPPPQQQQQQDDGARNREPRDTQRRG